MKKNRTILLLAPRFYMYHKEIIKVLKNKGFEVKYINDGYLGSLNFIFKLSFIDKLYFRHLKNKIENNLRRKFDFFFVIKGYSLTKANISFSKIKEFSGRKILYQWDSLKNYNYRNIISLFDKVVTFDYADSKELGIDQLDLFYTEEYSDIGKKIVFSIGTFNEERYKKLNEIKLAFEKEDIRCNFFLYISLVNFIKRLLFGKSIDLLIFRKMSCNTIKKYFLNSSAIIDVTSENQTGLSMRSIEALGAQKKLLTNNEHIIKSTLFNSDNIYFLDSENNGIYRFINERNNENINDFILDSWIEKVVK